MSEDTKVGGEESVNEEKPSPKFTETPRDSATSTYDPKEIAKQVAEILRPDLEKTIQSTKDKRIAKLEKAVGLAELEEMGVAIPENVKSELREREYDQRLREVEARVGSAPQANSQGSGKAEASDWSRIVEEVGLDTKSPEYIEFMRQDFKNLDHFEAQAYRLKKKMDSKPNPSLETSPSLDGKRAATSDKEAMKSELQELQSRPTKENKARRAELAQKLRETK